MSTANLLVELFTEELPPKALRKLGESFADSIYCQLVDFGQIEEIDEQPGLTQPYEFFASPRRLAVDRKSVV